MVIPLLERVQRLKRWFLRENDRLLLGFSLEPYFPLHRYRGSSRHIPDGVVTPDDIVVEDFLDDYARLHDLYEGTSGDFIWSASPFFGIPWVEASLGCEVIADFSTGSTRAGPPAGFSKHPVVPVFSSDNPWVRKMREFIPALKKQSAGRYPVGVTLMRGISDLLAALYGGDEFVYRMMDSPEEVEEVAERLAEYWIAFGRHLLDNLDLFHGGTGSFFYAVWTPGRTIWFQEDAAALLSPAIYERFILPGNARIAEAFEHSVVHLHPSRFIPVSQLLRTRVNVIEIHIDKGGPTAEELHHVHEQVLTEKPLFVWGDVSDADLDFMVANLPHQGLAVSMVVRSQEQAESVWNRVMKGRAVR